MQKLISYVFTDSELVCRTDRKVKELIERIGFNLTEKVSGLCAEFYENKIKGQKIALVSMPRSLREDYYRFWIDEEEAVVTEGKNLRYLLEEDFNDWASLRGEWGRGEA